MTLIGGTAPTSSNKPIGLINSEINLKAQQRLFQTKLAVTGQSEKFKLQINMKQSFDQSLSSNVIFRLSTEPQTKVVTLEQGQRVNIKFANLVIMLKDGAKELRITHGINAGQNMIAGMLMSIAPGGCSDCQAVQWRLENKNFIPNFESKTEFLYVIKPGDPFSMQARFDSGSEFAQISLDFNNINENQQGALTSDFTAVWSTNFASLTLMETFKRLEATGSASILLDIPAITGSASFELTAPITGELILGNYF